MKYMKYMIPIMCVLAVMAGTGCSYVSDAIEGAIMERSSFSIEAENLGGDNIQIRWSELGSGQNFAGYEIYITDEADNEYAGYELVASRYYNDLSANLDDSYTNSYTYSDAGRSGVYFYRVGIINWDEDPEDRTIENGYSPEYDEFDPTAFETSSNYAGNTDIDKISGYARVVFE